MVKQIKINLKDKVMLLKMIKKSMDLNPFNIYEKDQIILIEKLQDDIPLVYVDYIALIKTFEYFKGRYRNEDPEIVLIIKIENEMENSNDHISIK